MEENNLQNEGVKKDLGKGMGVFASGLLSVALGVSLYFILSIFADPGDAALVPLMYGYLYLVVSFMFTVVCWFVFKRLFK